MKNLLRLVRVSPLREAEDLTILQEPIMINDSGAIPFCFITSQDFILFIFPRGSYAYLYNLDLEDFIVAEANGVELGDKSSVEYDNKIEEEPDKEIETEPEVGLETRFGVMPKEGFEMHPEEEGLPSNVSSNDMRSHIPLFYILYSHRM